MIDIPGVLLKRNSTFIVYFFQFKGYVKFKYCLKEIGENTCFNIFTENVYLLNLQYLD